MSFWKGIAQAIREEDEQKFAAEESEKGRQARKDDLMTQINARRQEALLGLLSNRKASAAEVDPNAKRDVLWLQNRIGGVEGSEDILAAAITDPSVASGMRKRVEEAEAHAEENQLPSITGQAIVKSFDVFGIDAQPGDIIDYNEMTREILEADLSDPETYSSFGDRIAGEDADARGAYVADYRGGLMSSPNDALEARQIEFFDKRVEELVGRAMEDTANLPDGVDPNQFASLMERYNEIGAPAFYDMFGEQVAREMSGTDTFRTAIENPVLRRFFIGDNTEEAIPTGAQGETEGDQFGEEPEATPKDQGIERATDVPKEVIEEIRKSNISFSQWKNMSRTEREDAGLPVSGIGGNWYYRSRYGSWGPFGTDTKATSANTQDDPYIIDVNLEGLPDADPGQIVGELVQMGELKTGDWFVIDGEKYRVK